MACAEMELLDISLTKDTSLFLHAIHSPFYWQILKINILFSGFQNPYKKSAKQKKLESIHEEHFVERQNDGISYNTRNHSV